MSTPAQQLSSFVHELGYSDIPPDVQAAAIRCLVNTVGLGLATHKMAVASIVTDLVTEWGGARESTIIASGARVPAPNATLANGTMVHALDYDDTHPEALSHPTSCIVPAALAVAEKVGAGGEELMAAIVAGLETHTRIGAAASTKFHARGFHPSFIPGCFAAALTAGRLLGLSPEQLTHAQGMCGTQAAGSFEWHENVSWGKRFGAGWAGHAGTISALMAQRGYTGPATIYEGRRGLFRTHIGEGDYSLERLTRGLGTEWETPRIVAKRYPCGHVSQAFMNAARTLRQRHGFTAEEIVDVECLIQGLDASLMGEPKERRRKPETPYEAQYSLYYTVAVALLRGEVDLDDFEEDRIRDPETLGLTQKIRYTVPEPGAYSIAFPATLIVRLRDGRELVEDRGAGDLDIVMTEEELLDKFRRNARRSLPSDQVERLLKALTEAASAGSVSDLMALTVAP